LATVLQAIAAGASVASAGAAADRLDRDRHLRAIRARHFGDLPATRAAAEIHVQAVRYCAAGWRLDRHKPTNPHPAGTLKAALWDLLKIGCAIHARRRMFDILCEMQ